MEFYATGDLLCALVYGIIIVNNLRGKGVAEKRLNGMIIKVGIIGIGLLCLTHLGHMLMGAYVGATLNLQYAPLYMQAVLELWGRADGIFLVITKYPPAMLGESNSFSYKKKPSMLQ